MSLHCPFLLLPLPLSFFFVPLSFAMEEVEPNFSIGKPEIGLGDEFFFRRRGGEEGMGG